MNKSILIITLVFIFPNNLLVSDPKPVFKKSFWADLAKNIELNHKIAKGHIDVLSYNTWGLPVSLHGHEQERRFNQLAETLIAIKKDIICLQETFHPKLRYQLASRLEEEFFGFSPVSENRSVFPFIKMDKRGGLMTLSKYPIIKEEFYQFPILPGSSIIEKVAKKGFLLSKIQYGKSEIFIVNTHMYAGDNKKAEYQRLNQIMYMDKVLNEKLDLKNEIVILMGDLNIHHPDVKKSIVYDYLTKRMGYLDSKPGLTGQDFTIDYCTNKFVPDSEIQTKLDYVFLSGSAACKTEIIEQSRAMESEKPLSDHYGWSASLKLVK